jgi:hypothetical protein
LWFSFDVSFFQAAIAKSVTIANPNHLELSIEQAIAESSSGDRCGISKLNGSGFDGDSTILP